MDKRKEEIIEVAKRRFSHYGYSKTTMNEIADDLKITKANLYYYYSDKSGLFKDIISSISDVLLSQEREKIESFKGDFLETLFDILRFRAEHMRKYYMFYINENLDWVRDVDFQSFMKEIETKDIEILKSLLVKAVDKGVLKLSDINKSVLVLRNIIKGIVINHTMTDVICGLPNIENIDNILVDQIEAMKLIFEERIVTNN